MGNKEEWWVNRRVVGNKGEWWVRWITTNESAAPPPRGEIWQCGYLNDITDNELGHYINRYKGFVPKEGSFKRNGYGVETQLVNVGLGYTSHKAMAHVCVEIAIEKTDLQVKTRQPPSMNG